MNHAAKLTARIEGGFFEVFKSAREREQKKVTFLLRRVTRTLPHEDAQTPVCLADIHPHHPHNKWASDR